MTRTPQATVTHPKDVIGALDKGRTPQYCGMHRLVNPQIGDVAWGHSRGRYRRGVVAQVTPTKVMLTYTTISAILAVTEYVRYVRARDDEGALEGWTRMYGTTWDYWQRTANQPPTDYGDVNRPKAMLEQHPDRDAFVRQQVAERKAELGAERAKVEATSDPADLATVTTKKVAKTDLWADPA